MAEQKPFVRKHFFINRQLQGRYMLMFCIPMLILLAFMLFTLYFATQSMLSTTTRIIKDEIGNKTALRFVDGQNVNVESYQALVDDINTYVRNFSADPQYRKAVVGSLMWVFGIGILLVIVQMTLLTIYFSHKLAGPIFRIEKTCHALIDGNYTDKVVLRKHDEMQNLAVLINEAVKSTNDRMRAMRDGARDEQTTKMIAGLKL